MRDFQYGGGTAIAIYEDMSAGEFAKNHTRMKSEKSVCKTLMHQGVDYSKYHAIGKGLGVFPIAARRVTKVKTPVVHTAKVSGPSPYDRALAILNSGVSVDDNSRGYLGNVIGRNYKTLSPAQEKWMRDLEWKVYRES